MEVHLGALDVVESGALDRNEVERAAVDRRGGVPKRGLDWSGIECCALSQSSHLHMTINQSINQLINQSSKYVNEYLKCTTSASCRI